MNKLRAWVYCHSFSLVMLAGFSVSSVVCVYLPAGKAFDYALTMAGVFLGGFVIVVASRWFYEKDADVLKPPKRSKDKGR